MSHPPEPNVRRGRGRGRGRGTSRGSPSPISLSLRDNSPHCELETSSVSQEVSASSYRERKPVTTRDRKKPEVQIYVPRARRQQNVEETESTGDHKLHVDDSQNGSSREAIGSPSEQRKTKSGRRARPEMQRYVPRGRRQHVSDGSSDRSQVPVSFDDAVDSVTERPPVGKTNVDSPKGSSVKKFKSESKDDVSKLEGRNSCEKVNEKRNVEEQSIQDECPGKDVHTKNQLSVTASSCASPHISSKTESIPVSAHTTTPDLVHFEGVEPTQSVIRLDSESNSTHQVESINSNDLHNESELENSTVEDKPVPLTQSNKPCDSHTLDLVHKDSSGTSEVMAEDSRVHVVSTQSIAPDLSAASAANTESPSLEHVLPVHDSATNTCPPERSMEVGREDDRTVSTVQDVSSDFLNGSQEKYQEMGLEEVTETNIIDSEKCGGQMSPDKMEEDEDVTNKPKDDCSQSCDDKNKESEEKETDLVSNPSINVKSSIKSTEPLQVFDGHKFDLDEEAESLELEKKLKAQAIAALDFSPPPAADADADAGADADEEEEDSWDKKFDDNGECLDPSLIEELTAHVGKVQIDKPKIDYLNFQPKEPDMDMEMYNHVIEIYDFPAEFLTRDLITAFRDYMSRGFEIKWVDDTHALAVFASSIAAQDALTLNNPLLKVRRLSEASRQSKMKAKKNHEFLQPFKARPETSASAARRLVSGALGLQAQIPREKREMERKQLKEAKEKRRKERRLKQDMWDGSVGRCAMDQES